MGAFYAPALLGAAFIRRFDIAASFDRWRRNFDGFLVVECGLAGFGKFPRIAFRARA